jgi:hypothetical protein
MILGLLSDFIVTVHVLWVAAVIVPVPLIIIGYFAKWQWIRHLWFRAIHFFMMALVLMETLLGIACPLTVWENQLQQLAGHEGYSRTFIGHYLHELIYYDFPSWVFGFLYAAFTLVIIALMIMVPPHRTPGK